MHCSAPQNVGTGCLESLSANMISVQLGWPAGWTFATSCGDLCDGQQRDWSEQQTLRAPILYNSHYGKGHHCCRGKPLCRILLSSWPLYVFCAVQYSPTSCLFVTKILLCGANYHLPCSSIGVVAACLERTHKSLAMPTLSGAQRGHLESNENQERYKVFVVLSKVYDETVAAIELLLLSDSLQQAECARILLQQKTCRKPVRK